MDNTSNQNFTITGMQNWSTGDDVLDLLFGQQLLASLQQQLNVQDESSSQVRGRLKVLTHTLQILKRQRFSRDIRTDIQSSIAGQCLKRKYVHVHMFMNTTVCVFWQRQVRALVNMLKRIPVFKHEEFHCAQTQFKRNLRFQHVIKSWKTYFHEWPAFNFAFNAVHPYPHGNILSTSSSTGTPDISSKSQEVVTSTRFYKSTFLSSLLQPLSYWRPTAAAWFMKFCINNSMTLG